MLPDPHFGLSPQGAVAEHRRLLRLSVLERPWLHPSRCPLGAEPVAVLNWPPVAAHVRLSRSRHLISTWSLPRIPSPPS